VVYATFAASTSAPPACGDATHAHVVDGLVAVDLLKMSRPQLEK
jgi:hypothetical protein